jgi:excisionase family DNA binding protein
MLNDHWMTSDEAAAYLKTTRDTILKWCREGRIPAHRLPGQRAYRFHAAELDAALGLDVDAARSIGFANDAANRAAGSSGFADDEADDEAAA